MEAPTARRAECTPSAHPMSGRADDTEAVPCLLRFHADWCPLCPDVAAACAALMTGYVFDEMVVDVADEDSSELVADYNVKKLPCLVLLHPDRSVAARLDGATPDAAAAAVKAVYKRRPPAELWVDF